MVLPVSLKMVLSNNKPAHEKRLRCPTYVYNNDLNTRLLIVITDTPK